MNERKPQTFIFGDIHGEFEKMKKLVQHLEVVEGLSLENGDKLVSLGDKNDRGPDSYGVFQAWATWKKNFPSQVTCILGNHEGFLRDAIYGDGARHGTELLLMNGGKQTIKSYGVHFGMDEYMNKFRAKFVESGHYDFLKEHVLWEETEDAFYCHAPVGLDRPANWEVSEEYCTWNYEGGNIFDWVDPDAKLGLPCFYGHIHNLRFDKEKRDIVAPKVRVIGNSYLIDTGCGCHANGTLTCVVLEKLRAYNSNGEAYQL